ncbi:MAG: hypothetical protein H3C63_14220, partial [Candidatus Omnitrophica bacterium]|nr:hypothetical protein [Candidatus Omnitrophota bacterium]
FERFQYIRRNRKPLTQELNNPSIAGRDYQIRAIRAVLEGIEQKRRGTRLLETSKPKPWCTEKEVFLILGCWDNFEYFKLNPKGKELKPQVPLPVRLARLSQEKERAETLKEAIVEKISELPLTINMNHDSHGKGKQDHFHCVTKMILKFNPIEFGGFMRAGR